MKPSIPEVLNTQHTNCVSRKVYEAQAKRIAELETVLRDVLFWVDPHPTISGNSGCECSMLSKDWGPTDGQCTICRVRLALGLPHIPAARVNDPTERALGRAALVPTTGGSK